MGILDGIDDIAGTVWNFVSEIPGEVARGVSGLAQGFGELVSTLPEIRNQLGISQAYTNYRGAYVPTGFVVDTSKLKKADREEVGRVVRDVGMKNFGEAVTQAFGRGQQFDERGNLTQQSYGFGALFDIIPQPIRTPSAEFLTEAVVEPIEAGGRFMRNAAGSYFMVTSGERGGLINMFNANDWKMAWEAMNDDVSFGQAVVFPLWQVDALDPESRAAFESSSWFDISSGMTDFMGQIFVEPDVFLGTWVLKPGLNKAVQVVDSVHSMQRIRDSWMHGRGFLNNRFMRRNFDEFYDDAQDILRNSRSEEYNRVIDPMISDLQETINVKVKPNKELISQIVADDPLVQRYIDQVREGGNVTTLKGVDELVDNIANMTREDVVELSNRLLSEPRFEEFYETLRRWGRSSTSVQLPDALAMRRVIQNTPATPVSWWPEGALYRRQQWINDFSDTRADLAFERGSDYIRPNEVSVGDELDIGVLAFSRHQSGAEPFGKDLLIKIVGGDVKTFPMPNALTGSEAEELVSGRFRVVDVRRPTDRPEVSRLPAVLDDVSNEINARVTRELIYAMEQRGVQIPGYPEEISSIDQAIELLRETPTASAQSFLKQIEEGQYVFEDMEEGLSLRFNPDTRDWSVLGYDLHNVEPRYLTYKTNVPAAIADEVWAKFIAYVNTLDIGFLDLGEDFILTVDNAEEFFNRLFEARAGDLGDDVIDAAEDLYGRLVDLNPETAVPMAPGSRIVYQINPDFGNYRYNEYIVQIPNETQVDVVAIGEASNFNNERLSLFRQAEEELSKGQDEVNKIVEKIDSFSEHENRQRAFELDERVQDLEKTFSDMRNDGIEAKYALQVMEETDGLWYGQGFFGGIDSPSFDDFMAQTFLPGTGQVSEDAIRFWDDLANAAEQDLLNLEPLDFLPAEKVQPLQDLKKAASDMRDRLAGSELADLAGAKNTDYLNLLPDNIAAMRSLFNQTADAIARLLEFNRLDPAMFSDLRELMAKVNQHLKGRAQVEDGIQFFLDLSRLQEFASSLTPGIRNVIISGRNINAGQIDRVIPLIDDLPEAFIGKHFWNDLEDLAQTAPHDVVRSLMRLNQVLRNIDTAAEHEDLLRQIWNLTDELQFMDPDSAAKFPGAPGPEAIPGTVNEVKGLVDRLYNETSNPTIKATIDLVRETGSVVKTGTMLSILNRMDANEVAFRGRVKAINEALPEIEKKIEKTLGELVKLDNNLYVLDQKARASAATRLARRYFPRHPQGETIAHLILRAPDKESARAVMDVLFGKGDAIRLLDEEIQHLEEAISTSERLKTELKGLEDLSDIPGQLALDLFEGPARLDRIRALREELKEFITNNSMPRFFEDYDHFYDATRLIAMETSTAEDLHAYTRDLMRELGDLRALRDYSRSLQNAPRSALGSGLKESVNSGMNMVRQSKVYRSHWAGKPVRLLMAPFDKRAFHLVYMHDVEDATYNMRAMLRQGGLDERDIDKWVGEVARPNMSAHQRYQIFLRAEEEAYRKIARDYGIPADELENVVSKATQGRRRVLNRADTQRFGTGGNDVFNIGHGVESQILPLFETQTSALYTPPDFTRLRRDIERLRSKGILPLPEEFQIYSNVAREAMDYFNSLVKRNLLLRPAWPLRVIGFDEGLRPLVLFGRMAMGESWYNGTLNLMRAYSKAYNGYLKKIPMNERLLRGLSRWGVPAVVGGAVGGLPGAAIGVGAQAGVRLLKNLDTLNNVGWGAVANNVYGADFQKATQGAAGQAILQRLSMQNSMSQYLAGETEVVDILFGDTTRWRTITPSDKSHLSSWRTVLNNQVKNSELARILLRGRGRNIDEFVDFLENTPKGRAIAEDMPIQAADPYEWGEKMAAELENLTQWNEEIIEVLLDEKKNVTSTMLEKLFPDDGARPNINGPEIDATLTGGLLRHVDKLTINVMKYLAEYPSDKLVRQPMFELWYRRELKRQIDLFAEEGKDFMEVSDVVRIEKAARAYALNQTKQFIYEFAARNEFHQMVRFISPFFPAAQEAVFRWAKIGFREPGRVAALIQFWRELDNVPWAEEDENGEIWFQFQIPEAAKGLLENGIFSEMANQQGVRIPKDSFNLIFNTELASGPFIRLSASEILKRKPEYENLLEWAVPYGLSEDALDALSGGILRNITEFVNKNGSERWQTLYLSTLMNMMVRVNLGELAYDLNDQQDAQQFMDDVQDAATSLWAFDLIVGASSPVPLIPQSPFNDYIEIARELRREYPEDWFDRFYEDYGDEFVPLAVGFTKMQAGIPPTQGGYRNYKEFENIIRNYPEWGAFIAGFDPANDEATKFSSAVYEWQKNTEFLPGSNEDMREFRAPAEFIEEPDIMVGWAEYINAMEWIDIQLRERGLSNLQQKGAEDLREMKDGAIDWLRSEYPAWYEDFSVVDRLAQERRLEGARAIVADERLIERPDVQALDEYLEVRDWIVDQLGQRAAAGGAKTLTAVANQDLLEAYENAVSWLLGNNPNFGPLYYRYFENDTISAEEQ